MKLTNSGFQRGHNPIVMEGDVPDTDMDFGGLLMEKGDTVSYNEPKECAYVLMTGKATSRQTDKEEAVKRKPCFHEDSILFHVPRNTAMELMCQSDKAEVSIQRTINPKHFEPELMKGEDLLCGFGLRGVGLMNEASTYIACAFLDRPNCPETNFSIGEVVSYPGKWFNFPPRIHVEPEIYLYRFPPENGHGHAEVGGIVHKVHHNDATCMVHSVTHSQVTAPEYTEYYIRAIRLRDNDPTIVTIAPRHAWVAERDVKYFPRIWAREKFQQCYWGPVCTGAKSHTNTSLLLPKSRPRAGCRQRETA